jgi:23S rRNA (guanosine2251-2'-O)-methyltransferase
MRRICLVAVDIRSIHNVGSFFRTADGFSAEIVLTGITPRPKGDVNDERLPHVINKSHAALSKTALGAENTVTWRYFADITNAVVQLRLEGFRIVALEQDVNSIPINELSGDESVAILVGPEVNGLSADVLKLCDNIYEIPMSGGKESFNVSVAAGIALYQSRSTK